MYNAYLATRQKARKQNEDSPATAAIAKTPGGGPKGHEELKAIGERNGPGPHENFRWGESNALSANQTLWHET